MEIISIVVPAGTSPFNHSAEAKPTLTTGGGAPRRKTWLQLDTDDIELERMPKAKLLSMAKLLVHYKYMLNFVDRHFLVGGIQSIMNTAVPQFRPDLQTCNEEYNELAGLTTFMRTFEDCWRRYKGDDDKVYVTASGDIHEVDWRAVGNTHSSAKRKAQREQRDEILISQKRIKKEEKLQDMIDKAVGAKKVTRSPPKPKPPAEPPKPDVQVDENGVMSVVTEYHCPYHNTCRFKASSMDIVEGHVQRFHINSQLISCQYLYCFQMFENQSQLDEHLINVHGPNGGLVRRNFRSEIMLIPCPVMTCDEVVVSKMKLKWHLFRKHRTEYMTCSRCNKQYAQRKNLCRHVRTVHKELREDEKLAILLVNDKDDEFDLDEQGQVIVANPSTANWVEVINEGEGTSSGDNNKDIVRKKLPQQYQCIIDGCRIIYTREADLRAHLLSDHPDISLKCQFCGQFCGDHKKMYYHHYYHHREGRHICKEQGCEFECSLFIDMKKHNNACHARLFGCKIEGCDELVPQTLINKHRREVHGIPTEKKHACSWPECGKRFTSATKLKSHLRTHVNLKRYGCMWPECGYRSEQKETVVVHIRVCHFKLPRTVREQREKNIVVDQNPYDWVEALPEDVIVNS